MVQAQIFEHIVRRGIDAVSSGKDDFYINQLKQTARLYEDSDVESIGPAELMPMIITGIVFMLIFASVRYTLGEVIATLAMIEQPQTSVFESTTSIKDVTDPSSEKERLIDEEVIVVKQAPITSQIRKTIQHLHSVGGFTARWRGLGVSLMYHMLHSFSVNFLTSFFMPNLLLRAAAFIVSSVLLARIHMTWTHVMITKPSTLPWFKRIAGDRQTWKTLALPSFVFATAQILTIGLPMCVFAVMHGMEMPNKPIKDMRNDEMEALAPNCMQFGVAALTMFAVAVLILLPASVTLTRIEASLLPEDQETIVPFDRTFNGAVEPLEAASRKTLFIEAWRSYDQSSRLRLIKFYIKMAFIQFMIVVTGAHLIMTEMYLIGVERLTIFAQSAHAQLKLMALGVEQN